MVYRALPGSPREPEAFVWAGRFTEYKRPLLFVELAKAVPEARFVAVPHLPRSLDEAQQAIMREFEQAASSLPNFELSGSLPHASLMELFGRSVALVNTSSFEGMPNTFLEAWGQGIPVLTYSFDPDGVVGAKGLGVSAEGVWDRFVAGARDLWAGRFDREEMAQRVRAHVRDNHSFEAVGARWREVLEHLGVPGSG